MDIKLRRWTVVILAIIANALGNAMLAYANLGNTYWGVAAQNISAYTGIEFGTAIIAITVTLFIYNRIALKQYRPLLDTLSFIVTVSFGIFINMFYGLLATYVPIENNPVLANIIWAGGLIIMTMSISMYLKPHLIVPAFDENMDVFAKLYFNGNYAKAGYLAMVISMVVILVVGLLNDKTFLGFNLYSLFVIVVFAPMIQFWFNHMKGYDKFIRFGEFEENKSEESSKEATV